MQNLPYTAILFDFDGTIRDFSWDRIVRAYRAIMRHYGKNPEDYWYLASPRVFARWFDNDWRNNLVRMHVPESKETHSVFHENYDSTGRLVFSEFVVFLRILASRYRLAILSANTREKILHIIHDSGLDGVFYTIISADDVRVNKPSPEGLLIALEILEVSNDETLLIGDADVDILAAHSGRVDSAFVSWGYHQFYLSPLLYTLGPTHFFHSPYELFSFFLCDEDTLLIQNAFPWKEEVCEVETGS